MFKRYGDWLLLFCALVLLFALTCVPQQLRSTPTPIQKNSGESHYIISDDGARLNINLATRQELIDLPAIGETLAERILQYREANGPFASINDLTNVSGIGDAKLQQIAPYIATE